MMGKEVLESDLPKVVGSYRFNVSLAPFSWFRVGGCAEVLYRPHSLEDLLFFMENKPSSLALTCLGVGSNVLIRDAGVPGVTVRTIGPAFSGLSIENEFIYAGAGVLDRTIALACLEKGVAGLEFLVGIPGTLGGALRMNAGAYGREIKDVLVEAKAIDTHGKLVTLRPEDFGFSYRRTLVPKEWIFVSAMLKGQKGDGSCIREKTMNILQQREATQPIRARTGGSTFKNPEGYKAWELIEAAGCRGLTIGGAQVSEKHCNFLVNLGHATAHELEMLGEEVRARVLTATGITLEWEVHKMGLAKKRN